MKRPHSLNRVITAVITIAALAGMCLILGVSPAGDPPPAFEYKVFSQTTLIKIVALEMLKQQEGTQPPGATGVMQQSSEWASEMSKQIEAALNELGSEGWELAGVTDSFCILKRPKS